MQWSRPCVLDLSWNLDCLKVPGASFLTLSFLLWNEGAQICFRELFYELHEMTHIRSFMPRLVIMKASMINTVTITH